MKKINNKQQTLETLPVHHRHLKLLYKQNTKYGMKKINNQQTKKVETTIMLNTRLVHGPSAILELHVQSVRGQKFTRDIISSDL